MKWNKYTLKKKAYDRVPLSLMFLKDHHHLLFCIWSKNWFKWEEVDLRTVSIPTHLVMDVDCPWTVLPLDFTQLPPIMAPLEFCVWGHCEYFMSVADMPSVLRVLCSCTCCVVPSDLPYLEQWQQSIKPPRGILLSNCTGHVSLEISYASGFSENPTHTSQCLDISRAVSHSRSWQCLDFRSILCLPSPHPAAAKIHTASHRLTAGSLLSPRSSLRDTKETFLNMIGFLLKWPWWGCSWALWTPSCQSIEFVFCFFCPKGFSSSKERRSPTSAPETKQSRTPLVLFHSCPSWLSFYQDVMLLLWTYTCSGKDKDSALRWQPLGRWPVPYLFCGPVALQWNNMNAKSPTNCPVWVILY